MATMRRLTMHQLTTLGFTKVDQAENGLQALEYILKAKTEDQPFGLVISDWNMPNMSGIELLEVVRSNQAIADLPFMLVTAEDEKAQVVRALKSKVNDYLIKPIDKAVLEQKLTMLIQTRKSNRN